MRSARELDQLKTALLQGGLSADHLAQLVCVPGSSSSRASSFSSPYSDGNRHRQVFEKTNIHDSWRTPSSPTSSSRPLNNGTHARRQDQAVRHQIDCRSSSFGHEMAPDVNDSIEDFMPFDAAADEEAPNRTLYFAGLPVGTTYRDLLSVIRGGKVLLISLRQEKCATVTLVSGAAEFLTWAKRNDIYIKGKRVEVRWAERQYRLNHHVGHQIGIGTTRNLVIHSALDSGLDEQRIREDMEHIHTLFIVDITFRGPDAYVSTNSVNNAMFARTCMMSRRDYKGRKIGFFPDECDVPLPASRNAAAVEAPKHKFLPVKSRIPLTNMFGMLDVDADSGEEDESDEEPGAPLTHGRRTCDDDDATINHWRRSGG